MSSWYDLVVVFQTVGETSGRNQREARSMGSTPFKTNFNISIKFGLGIGLRVFEFYRHILEPEAQS
jgi:hypothetical protein